MTLFKGKAPLPSKCQRPPLWYICLSAGIKGCVKISYFMYRLYTLGCCFVLDGDGETGFSAPGDLIPRFGSPLLYDFESLELDFSPGSHTIIQLSYE